MASIDATELFGDAAADLQSYAYVPLRTAGVAFGLLVMASEDERRFYAEMGMFHSCVLEGSWKTDFHTENQPKYAQFQSVGIKDKLNTRALQLAQLTPPS